MPLIPADRDVKLPLAWIGLGFGIVYVLLWIWNEYVAMLTMIIMAGVSFVVLVIAGIAELVESSQVPRHFFYLLILSFVIPTVLTLLFFILTEGYVDGFR